jgi:hypothetical protein
VLATGGAAEAAGTADPDVVCVHAAGGSSGSCVVSEAAAASASRREAAVGTGRLEVPWAVATLVVLEEAPLRLLLSSTGDSSSPPNNRPRSACRSAAVVRNGSEELAGVVDADAGLAEEDAGVAKLLGSFRDCCNNACAARAGRLREATTAGLLASEALVASEASWRSARTIREAARLRSGMLVTTTEGTKTRKTGRRSQGGKVAAVSSRLHPQPQSLIGRLRTPRSTQVLPSQAGASQPPPALQTTVSSSQRTAPHPPRSTRVKSVLSFLRKIVIGETDPPPPVVGWKKRYQIDGT